MSMNIDNRDVLALLKIVLRPLFIYNPFFSLYYNPLVENPRPYATEKPYYNYIHQVSLLLDLIPRSGIRVLIGDEVGLGKTVEAIRIIKYLYATGQARKILIMAPRSLIKQWLYHDIRDLLYSPRKVRRITRKTIDEIHEKIARGIEETAIYLAPIDLVKRGSLDKHSRGYFKPYHDFISRISWDLIVVDEAHLLGFTGTRTSMRTQRLAPICESAKHLVLLSATPSRGTHEDFLGRLTLLIPSLRRKLKYVVKDSALRENIYKLVNGYMVYRRTKDFVNTVENRKVFTDLYSLMALVKLGDKGRLYEDLGRIVTTILTSLEQEASALVKVIVIRRALSSPYAFLKTLGRVLTERIDIKSQRAVSSAISERILEEKADHIVESVIRSIAGKIPSSIRPEILRLVEAFKELYDEGDPSFKALSHLLYSVLMKKEMLPKELIGDYVIFSEYRDTVEYIYGKLIEFFKSKGFKQDVELKNDVIERTVSRYYEKKYYDSVSEKYSDMLRDSIEILVDTENNKYLFIAYLSSFNQDIIHLMPELVESIDERAGGEGLKILVSTDIASEGLNLYQFNIVVNYDVPWSPTKREQRVGRVHRLRQTRSCTLLDFVRDTTVDYEFYTKLVLKLLNIVEQRIQSKPLEGVIELYLATGRSGEEYLQVSEMDIATALCRVYEDYYVHGKDPRIVLSDIRAELAKKIKEYRELSESLAKHATQPEDLRSYVQFLTGCSDHRCFEEIVRELYSLLMYKPGGDASRIPIDRVLLEIYMKTVGDESLQPDSSLTILVRDSGIERGYLGIVDLVACGSVRYSMPILVLYRDENPEIKYGLEVVKWITNHAKNQSIRVTRVLYRSERTDLKELRGVIWQLRNRFNILFKSRLSRKASDLARVLQASGLMDLVDLDVVLEHNVIKVLGVQGLEEYERYLSTLPPDKRAEMEKESVGYIKELYESRGCSILEVNIGIYKPYDLLAECVEDGETVRYMVEVKSHLKQVFVAELTPAETELAEQYPDRYIVCNVAGLERSDRSSWITMCDLYGNLKKELVTMKKEEKIARLYFT